MNTPIQESLIETTTAQTGIHQQWTDPCLDHLKKRVSTPDKQIENTRMGSIFYTVMSVRPSVTPWTTLSEHNLHTSPKNRTMPETTTNSSGASTNEESGELFENDSIYSVDYKDFPNPPSSTPSFIEGHRDPTNSNSACTTLTPFMHLRCKTSRFTELFDFDWQEQQHQDDDDDDEEDIKPTKQNPVLSSSSHSLRGLLRSLSTTASNHYRHTKKIANEEEEEEAAAEAETSPEERRWNMTTLFYDVIRRSPSRRRRRRREHTLKEKEEKKSSPVPSLTASPKSSASSFSSKQSDGPPPRLNRRSTEGDKIGANDRHGHYNYNHNNNNNKSQVLEDDYYLKKQLPPLPWQ